MALFGRSWRSEGSQQCHFPELEGWAQGDFLELLCSGDRGSACRRSGVADSADTPRGPHSPVLARPAEAPPSRKLQTAQQSPRSDTPRPRVGLALLRERLSPQDPSLVRPGGHQGGVATSITSQARSRPRPASSCPTKPDQAPGLGASGTRLSLDAFCRSSPSAPTWLGSLARSLHLGATPQPGSFRISGGLCSCGDCGS